MAEQTEAQTSTEPAVSEPHSTPEATPGEDEQQFSREYVTGLRNEARRHRTSLREAEAERDQLRARLDVHDRADVERIASERLHDPADLLDRAQLADLRGEDGTLDEDAVRSRVEQLAKERPHLARPRGGFDGGIRGTAMPQAPPSFGEALKSR